MNRAWNRQINRDQVKINWRLARKKAREKFSLQGVLVERVRERHNLVVPDRVLAGARRNAESIEPGRILVESIEALA